MRLRFTLFIVALLASIGANAGTFVASLTESYETSKLHSLVFGDGKVRTYFDNGDMNVYDFSSVQRLYYTEPVQESVVNDVTDGEVVTLFPNPASDVVYVSGIEAGADVRVLDISGREVMRTRASEDVTEINISALREGMYFVVADGRAFKLIKK